MQYKLQAFTFQTGGIPFEYGFDCVGETHHRAIDLAREYVKKFTPLFWVEDFVLFSKHDLSTERADWKPVCKITLERSTTTTVNYVVG